MSKSLRGGNTAHRVQEQRKHTFMASQAELEEKTKDELLSIADDLGVLAEIPANGETSVPLKSDLVSYLTSLSGQFHS